MGGRETERGERKRVGRVGPLGSPAVATAARKYIGDRERGRERERQGTFGLQAGWTEKEEAEAAAAFLHSLQGQILCGAGVGVLPRMKSSKGSVSRSRWVVR